MAKSSYTYVIIRLLFGMYLIYHGITGYSSISQNQGYFFQTLDAIDRKFIKPYEINLNFDSLKESSAEMLLVANFSIMLGGYYAILGYKISKYFVAMGLVFDFIFVHNFLFLKDGKMLNFTIKAVSILGGALVIR